MDKVIFRFSNLTMMKLPNALIQFDRQEGLTDWSTREFNSGEVGYLVEFNSDDPQNKSSWFVPRLCLELVDEEE